MSRLASCLIGIVMSAASAPAARQATEIEWLTEQASIETTRIPLSASDKRSIAQLAGHLGLPSVARVEVSYHSPGVCAFLHVTSAVVEDGLRRHWFRAEMRPRQWRACSRPEPGAAVKRVGRWSAATSDTSHEERWQIRDGPSWSVYVQLEDGSIYADADAIVKAIRRGELINRIPPIEFGPDRRLEIPMPSVVANDRMSIWRERSITGGYRVHVDGAVLTITIVDGRVEVHSAGSVSI